MLLAKLGTVYLPTTNSVGASPTSPEPQAGYVATSNNGCESLETRDGKWNDVAGTSPQFFLCESRLSLKMQSLSDEYTDFETYHMLAYSIKNVINQVPVGTLKEIFSKNFVSD